MAKYRMATLFSGAGGLDSGFAESDKFEMLFAKDVLPTPAESYSKNFSHSIVKAKKFGANKTFNFKEKNFITKLQKYCRSDLPIIIECTGKIEVLKFCINIIK